MAYLSAPLWFLFLALSTALLVVNATAEPVYFTEPNQLFPNWPEWHPEWAIRLFGLTASLLFLPKLLAALAVLVNGEQRRYFGGGIRLLLSLVLEMLFSALLAPVRMLFHTRFVVLALLGISVVWKSPPREDSQTPWCEALARHSLHTLIGAAWLYGVYRINPEFITWLIPVAGALLVCIPASVFSSRVSWGRLARNARLFLIPEEANPARELRRLKVLASAAPEYGNGFERALKNPATRALMTAFAPIRRKPAPVPQEVQQAAALGQLEALDEHGKNRVLWNRRALRELAKPEADL